MSTGFGLGNHDKRGYNWEIEMRLRHIYPLKITFNLVSKFEFNISHFVSNDSRTFIVILFMYQRHLFTSIHHKFKCDICCCVKWTSLVIFDAACYRDVDFHIPTEGRNCSSSCYATSLAVSTCDLQYDLNFVASA